MRLYIRLLVACLCLWGGFIFAGCSKMATRGYHVRHGHSSQGQVAHTKQTAMRDAPGLGTAYGRSVYAPIRYVGFVRATSMPSTLLQMHYNDPQGVLAMSRSSHGCCGPVSVQHRGGVSLQLVSPGGRTLSGMSVAGKTVVMGRHGHHYHILLRNHTGLRKEAVVSVDGLDVVDGQRARFRKRGYILQPYGVLRIRGFRRSHSQVAAFRFSTVRHSYASRTGQGGHIGVIGAAIFDERQVQWQPDDLQERLQARPFAAPSGLVR